MMAFYLVGGWVGLGLIGAAMLLYNEHAEERSVTIGTALYNTFMTACFGVASFAFAVKVVLDDARRRSKRRDPQGRLRRWLDRQLW